MLGISFLISKLLGLARDNLLAAEFGAGTGVNPASAVYSLDVYYAAFRLPDLLFNLLSYGVLSAAFIPLFAELLKKEGRDRAFLFANEILHAIGGIVIIITAVLLIFAPQIVKPFVPGFDAVKFNATADLTRIMLLTPILFTIGSVAGGIQNVFNKFWGLSLAPIFYNIGIIGGIALFSKQYGVYGVAAGVAAGAMMNMLVQLPGIFRAGYTYIRPPRIWTNKVKEMIALSLPRIFGMSAAQLSLIIDTMIASTLAGGSIAVINFATNLQSLPIGLVGISVAIASFGTMSSMAAEGKMQDLINEITVNIRRILFLLIPLALGMLTLRLPIVRLLLGRGKFSSTDTILTANTMGILLSGLVFGGLIFVLARAFYALKNTKTPVIISTAAIILKIASTILLTKIFLFGTYGLALATSLADIMNAALLIIFLSKRLKTSIIDTKEIAKFVFSGLVMVGAVQLIFKLTTLTAAAVLTGIFVYLGMCWLLKCKDVKKLLTLRHE